jgi:flagellin-like hook-associated protein FlgL
MLQNISSVGQQFLANLETLDQNMATTQEQLSSGTTINKPSDNPANSETCCNSRTSSVMPIR